MSKDLKSKMVKMFKDIEDADFGNHEWFFLLDLAQRVSLVSGFQYLLSLEDLNIKLFKHQAKAALQVLQNMQGSSLLADEVGLGKTIIALTVLSELQIRNLVDSVLIIAPTSLVNQWHSEIIEKFNMDIPVVATGRSNFKREQLITSINMVRRYPDRFLDRSWDMVIVDEAHRIKNRKTKAWQILNQLRKKYMLLLTATPMENYLKDIYNLVTLLKPIFGSYGQFKKQFSVPNNKRDCKDPLKLRQDLNQVMIRRKREDIKGIFFPERVANTLQFDMNDQEKKFYNTVSDYVISTYAELGEEKIKQSKKKISQKYNLISSDRYFKRKIWLHKFTLMLLQRRICSSPYSARITIKKMIESRKENEFDLESVTILENFYRLAEKLSREQSTKLIHLEQLLKRVPNKCVIFTEFKDTLDYIAEYLESSGFSFIKFSGELSSKKRAEVIRKFYEEKDILLSTDAGSEGLNLQVADTLINFDLPWNPMRIEQRIGRIYRLTQKAQQINIFNLASKDSIEAYVLDVLYQKLGVFRTILGDLNHILGKLINPNADGRSTHLEGEIMNFFVKHGHSEKLRQELQNIIQPVVEKVDIQENISEDVLDVDSLIDMY